MIFFFIFFLLSLLHLICGFLHFAFDQIVTLLILVYIYCNIDVQDFSVIPCYFVFSSIVFLLFSIEIVCLLSFIQERKKPQFDFFFFFWITMFLFCTVFQLKYIHYSNLWQIEELFIQYLIQFNIFNLVFGQFL